MTHFGGLAGVKARYDLVVVGTSTGGLHALTRLLGRRGDVERGLRRLSEGSVELRRIRYELNGSG